jgi:ABC-type nickel/cobalt efflux system permease component RcnA
MYRHRDRLLFILLVTCLAGSLILLAAPLGHAHEPIAPEDEDLLTALVSMTDLPPSLMALSVVIAIALGAIHALSPGHGKALVAAYLVGSRSNAKDAVLLGGIVTLTHTGSVFLLGIVTLLASNWLMPETFIPWLSIISGGIVFGVGVFLMATRLRHNMDVTIAHDHGTNRFGHRHQHGHDHHHVHLNSTDNDPNRLNRRSLLALGVSGGALPCPSALMLLLAAISLNRIAFGLVLLIAFSFGLGAVLTLTGLLFLKTRNLIDRFCSQRMLNWLPVASASVIMVLGFAISVRALRTIF